MTFGLCSSLVEKKEEKLFEVPNSEMENGQWNLGRSLLSYREEEAREVEGVFVILPRLASAF
jgi:hypothetical protein